MRSDSDQCVVGEANPDLLFFEIEKEKKKLNQNSSGKLGIRQCAAFFFVCVCLFVCLFFY
jgi:hypothetical protein